MEEDEARRPDIARKAEDAERASRAAELALAKATADHAGVEAEWRVAEAEIAQAKSRLTRLEEDQARIAQQLEELTGAGDPMAAVEAAQKDAQDAAGAHTRLRADLEEGQARKAMLQDISILTKGEMVSEDLGIKLENVTLGMLGEAKRVTIDKDNTTIVDGAGSVYVHNDDGQFNDFLDLFHLLIKPTNHVIGRIGHFFYFHERNQRINFRGQNFMENVVIRTNSNSKVSLDVSDFDILVKINNVFSLMTELSKPKFTLTRTLFLPITLTTSPT